MNELVLKEPCTVPHNSISKEEKGASLVIELGEKEITHTESKPEVTDKRGDFSEEVNSCLCLKPIQTNLKNIEALKSKFTAEYLENYLQNTNRSSILDKFIKSPNIPTERYKNKQQNVENTKWNLPDQNPKFLFMEKIQNFKKSERLKTGMNESKFTDGILSNINYDSGRPFTT